MTDYTPTKGKYTIPGTVWNRTLWLIRDYDRMKLEADTILTHYGGSLIFSGGSYDVSDQVARKVMLRENYLDSIKVIEKAFADVPEEYREGIWNSIQHRERYPFDADPSTYSRQKRKYIKTVAEAMNYI